jgi:hypothetical protein
MPFPGGEEAALARLKHYLWDSDALATYFETRNGMLGADYSSKARAPRAEPRREGASHGAHCRRSTSQELAALRCSVWEPAYARSSAPPICA